MTHEEIRIAAFAIGALIFAATEWQVILSILHRQPPQ